MRDIVRLPEKSISAIITAFQQTFAADDHIWIFGSRVDMQARGGDIDLYIETTVSDVDSVIKRKSRMVSQRSKISVSKVIEPFLNIVRTHS